MLKNGLICKKKFDDFYTFIIGDDPNKLDEFISKMMLFSKLSKENNMISNQNK